MSRKLASVQRISNIRPIPDADSIEAVDVLGWTVVCKKGEFTVGDLVMYFEVDSWLDSTNPAFATFEERFTNWGTKRGMRLRTIKLRKQISQGLVLPLTSFPSLPAKVQEGFDATELLGIEKWESLEEQKSNSGGGIQGSKAKQFPSFIRKTDQERVQNMLAELPKHSEGFEITVKLDGSSMSIYAVEKSSPYYQEIVEEAEEKALKRMGFLQKGLYMLKRRLGLIKQPHSIVGVCSRNIDLGLDGDNHFSNYAREHNLVQAVQKAAKGRSFAIQGELIAPSIQSNYEQVKGFEYYVFDVFDIDKQEYLLPEAARNFVLDAGLKYVPVLDVDCKLCKFGTEPREMVDAILAYAEGPGMNKGVKREGVVFKSNTDVSFSFKAISNSYLMKAK